MESLESLLSVPFLGKSSDTFLYYLPPAYSIFKYGKPIITIGDRAFQLCYRVVQSFIFVPFMAAFKGYFPILFLLLFSLAFANLLALLLWELNPGRFKLNLLLSFLILPLVFYHLPFLMLEAPTSTFLLGYVLFLIKYRKSGSLLHAAAASFFLAFAVLLRPETVLLAIPILFMGRSYLPTSALLLFPLGLNFWFSKKCGGDQANFYLWAYASHVERERGKPYGDITELLENVERELRPCLEAKGVADPSSLGFSNRSLNIYMQLFQTNNREYSSCFRSLLLKDLNEKDILVALFTVPMNFISLLFPSLSPLTFPKFGPLKWPFRIFIFVYSLLSLIAVTAVWRVGGKFERLAILSYALLILVYAAYNPFGMFDALRFKLYLLPFEVMFLGKGYPRYNNRNAHPCCSG